MTERVMVLEYACGMCPWRRKKKVCRQRESSLYNQRTGDDQRCLRLLEYDETM